MTAHDPTRAMWAVDSRRLRALAARHGAEVQRVDGWLVAEIDGVTYRAKPLTAAEDIEGDRAAEKYFRRLM